MSEECLTVGTLLRMARGEVPLFPIDCSAMSRAHSIANMAVATAPIYGRSTGVGANKSVELSEDNSLGQDLRLLRSHATGTGSLVDSFVVRTAIIIRLKQLLRGGSGVGPDAAKGLAALLERDSAPRVHEVGSLGIGDLSQMSELALTMLGERALVDGHCERLWKPSGGDGLSFISSNAFTVAAAVRVCVELESFIDHYCHVAATSFFVTGSNIEPLAAEVQESRPQPGQQEAAARIRDAIGGLCWQPRRQQDSFGFRAVVPVLSTLLNCRRRLVDAIEVEINSSPENPLISTESENVLHNGNFHTQQLMVEIEAAGLALFGAAQLSFNRTVKLSEPDITGLPPFLSDETPGSSGTMMVEYVGASALNQLRIHAQPASLTNIAVSRGTEDHAPFTAQAAQQVVAGIGEARRVLAAELLCASRAVAMNGTAESTAATPPFLDYVDRVSTRNTTFADRALSDDIAILEEFLTASFETLKLRK